MNHRIAAFLLTAGALAAPALAVQARAQTSPLPLPSPVEKELAARASDVTEVTLGKNMLAFAAKFMHGKDDDEAATRHLIEGLDGIYVRDYSFDKDNQYSPDDIESLRKYFETSEWSPIVHTRERKSGESTDVLVKLVNGENKGMFILDAEPRELSIVLILGPINIDELGHLHGIGGLHALGDVERNVRNKDREKDKEGDKEKDKEKDKDKQKEKDNQKEQDNKDGDQ
jgi:Sec-independent protein translocase protein TatA